MKNQTNKDCGYMYLPLESTTSKDPIAKICIEREFNIEDGIRIGGPLLLRSRDGNLFEAGIISDADCADDCSRLFIETKSGEEFVFRI